VRGGTAVVLHSPEAIAGLRALCAVAERASGNGLAAVHQAISEPPLDLARWKALADERQLYYGQREPLDVDVATLEAPEAVSRHGVELLQLLLSIAEDIWTAQDEEAEDLRLIVAVAAPAADAELEVELGQPALLLHPGSIVARLARKALKIPVFFLGLAVGGGAFAETRIATAMNRLRARAKRRYPDSPILPDIRTISEATVAGKRGLVVFLHGLLATDVGLFDRLITALEPDDKLLLVGFPHDTLAPIADNGEELAHELRTRVGVDGPPVAFIAHSRGGLVARSAIARLIAGKARWREQLRTCITFGTPHQGAAAAGAPPLFIGTYVTCAWVRSTGALLTGLPDILSYWTDKGEFRGIDDLKPDGAFLRGLREREGEDGMDVFAFGGKHRPEGAVGVLTKRLYGDLENDWVVEVTSSARKLFLGTRTQQTRCNHFQYFQGDQQEHLDEAVRHLRSRLTPPETES
jgi:Putative serine esterase (DUF676)